MQFDFQPYIGAGPLRFGMTPVEVTDFLGVPDDTIVRKMSPEEPDTFEYIYLDDGLLFHFCEDRRVDAISFSGSSSLIFKGVNLRTTPAEILHKWISEIDPEAELFEGLDLQSNRFGFVTYSPVEDPGIPPDWIMIFRRSGHALQS